MKRGDRRTITIEGQKLDAEFLGQGHYAKAWRVGDDVYLFVTGCYMKEAIEDLKSQHIPRVERIERVAKYDGNDTHVYKMPFFEPLTPKHEAAWAQFRELQRANEVARTAVTTERGWDFSPYTWLSSIGYAVNQRLVEIAQVPEALKEALQEMTDAAANYGSGVTFEFAKRNLSVDGVGNLILRDVLFDSEKLEREQHAAMKKRERERTWGLSR